MDMRVFWAVLAALGIAGLGVLSYQWIRDYESRVALDDAMHQVSQVVTDSQQQMEADHRRQFVVSRQASARDYNSRVLASNQRCVGGSVVMVQGHDYQQIGTIQNPVHCVGRIADRPIR